MYVRCVCGQKLQVDDALEMDIKCNKEVGLGGGMLLNRRQGELRNGRRWSWDGVVSEGVGNGYSRSPCWRSFESLLSHFLLLPFL